MLECRDVDDVFAEIVISNGDVPCKGFFLIEGPDEASILSSCVDSNIETIVCGGCDTVESSIREFYSNSGPNRDEYPNLIGLMDRDFGVSDQRIASVGFDHLAITDNYDFVADIVESLPGVVVRVMESLHPGSSRKAREVFDEDIETVALRITSKLSVIFREVQNFDYFTKADGTDYSKIFGGFSESSEGVIRWPKGEDFVSAVLFLDRHKRLFVVGQDDLSLFSELSDNMDVDRSICGGHLFGVVLGQLSGHLGKVVPLARIEPGIRSNADGKCLSSLTCVRRLQQLSLRFFGVPLFDFGPRGL
jgi:hypothetical protein